MTKLELDFLKSAFKWKKER